MLRQPRIRLVVVIAASVVAALIVWGAAGDDETPSTSPSSGADAAPTAVSAQRLRGLSARLDQPIYWAGRRAGYKYEVTRTRAGAVTVRYLPPEAPVGEKSADFLLVATYPYENDLNAIEAIANGRAIDLPGGGKAVVDEGYPESVHLAFPDVDYQVEVYDPSPQRSLSVATSGEVAPVR